MRKCFPVELVLLSLSVFVVHGAEVSEGGDGARLLSDVRARVSQRRYRMAREIALTALRSARPGLLRAELEFWVGESYRLEGDPEEGEVNENEESIPLDSRSNSTSRVETEDVPEESSSSDSSIIKDEEPRGDKYFEFKVLEKLFISEFKVFSEEGR